MIILPKKIRNKAAREVHRLVMSGVERKRAFLVVSTSLRSDDFKCTTRTIYRWLGEFGISLR